MADYSAPKDGNLEALDFIVNALKEHEKTLDTLIGNLATVTAQIDDTSKLSDKVEKVEEKINYLQKQIVNFVHNFSFTRKENIADPVADPPGEASLNSVIQGKPSIVLQCKHWEDFQTFAFQAQTITFLLKENEQVLQADALKGNRLISYNGGVPIFSSGLKSWLTEALDVPMTKIFEGSLTLY